MHIKISDFLKIARSDIIFIVGISSLAGFLSNPSFVTRPLVIIPLLVSGLLASASAALFNNLYDSDLDGKMERTKHRVDIIDNNRRSLTAAGIMMLVISIVVAYLVINLLSSIFMLLGFATYTIVYTILLKRRTYWSIVIGGAAASFAALSGWTSVDGGIGRMAIYLAILLFAWIPMHFWSFAASHTGDYENAGIPILPAVIGLRKSSMVLFVNSLVLAAIAFSSFFINIKGSLPAYIIVIVALSIALCYVNSTALMGNRSEKNFHSVYRFSHLYISVILVMAILMNGAFL